MKTSEFLKIAKRDYLAYNHSEWRSSDKQRYLCLAIADCGFDLKQTLIVEFLRNRIEKAIGGLSTVESWLHEIHKVPNKELFYYDRYNNYCQTQALFDYRHRWIDELILEYETKGD